MVLSQEIKTTTIYVSRWLISLQRICEQW